ASPAAAHSGQGPIAVLHAGPYTVQPYDADRGDTGDVQRFPLTVYDAPNHKATDVSVSVSAVDVDGKHPTGVVAASASLNGFQAQLPPAPAGGWVVTVIVTGPLGSGQATYLAHPIQQASPTSGAAILLKAIVGTFGLAILTTVIVVAIRGRRRLDEDAELDALQTPSAAEGDGFPSA
ncbi:MAG: hypothetical protein QOC60_1774, partial [Frankiaceae bacterium]|nr:hypothetical protein [Frankiaceae bacterium]